MRTTSRLTTICWLLGVAFGLTACGQGSAGDAATGTVSGVVVVGPTCPVEGSTPCPPAPASEAQVEVRRDGVLLGQALTDGAGRFSLPISVGRVEVTATLLTGIKSSETKAADVTADHTVTLSFELDSGIRAAATAPN